MGGSAVVNVNSEIGKLKKVVLHRPGQELEQLSPSSLEDLLFDDIPYLEIAQKEHDEFANVLRENGAEVLYLSELAAQALATSKAAKQSFVDELIEQSGNVASYFSHELGQYLMSMSELELIKQAMTGVTEHHLNSHTKGPLCRLLPDNSDFLLSPMPNLYFTRDPFASVGNAIVHSHMRYAARHRETIFSKYIFNHHPDFKNNIKYYYKNHWPFYIEGGDILNLSQEVVAIGYSQRTYPQAIEVFAKNLFRDEACKIKTILVFEIPHVRAYMHLDTVFTQVSHDKFTIYAGIQKDITVFVLNRIDEKGAYSAKKYRMPLDEILAKYLNLDKVQLIPCGGSDFVSSSREQWNDAANTLAIAPGVVVCYNRNGITNRKLREEGIKVLEIASSELSRGRGGPRCMSMPLFRENL